MLTQGPVEKSILTQALRSGDPLPERILNAPELLPGLQIYLLAFFDLDSERTMGVAPGPIPYFKKVRYAKLHRFDESQREDLIFHLTQLDAFYLKRAANEKP